MGGGDYNPSALSGGGKTTDLADLNAQRLQARSSGTQSELPL